MFYKYRLTLKNVFTVHVFPTQCMVDGEAGVTIVRVAERVVQVYRQGHGHVMILDLPTEVKTAQDNTRRRGSVEMTLVSVYKSVRLSLSHIESV